MLISCSNVLHLSFIPAKLRSRRNSNDICTNRKSSRDNGWMKALLMWTAWKVTNNQCGHKEKKKISDITVNSPIVFQSKSEFPFCLFCGNDARLTYKTHKVQMQKILFYHSVSRKRGGIFLHFETLSTGQTVDSIFDISTHPSETFEDVWQTIFGTTIELQWIFMSLKIICGWKKIGKYLYCKRRNLSRIQKAKKLNFRVALRNLKTMFFNSTRFAASKIFFRITSFFYLKKNIDTCLWAEKEKKD